MRTRVVEITNFNDYLSLIETSKRLIIFFGAAGCGYCRAFTPLFEKQAHKHRNIVFAHVETTRVQSEGLEEGIPSFVSYRNGIFVDTFVGADEDRLDSMIEHL